jgi:TPR repeat protein
VCHALASTRPFPLFLPRSLLSPLTRTQDPRHTIHPARSTPSFHLNDNPNYEDDLSASFNNARISADSSPRRPSPADSRPPPSHRSSAGSGSQHSRPESSELPYDRPTSGASSLGNAPPVPSDRAFGPDPYADIPEFDQRDANAGEQEFYGQGGGPPGFDPAFGPPPGQGGAPYPPQQGYEGWDGYQKGYYGAGQPSGAPFVSYPPPGQYYDPRQGPPPPPPPGVQFDYGNPYYNTVPSYPPPPPGNGLLGPQGPGYGPPFGGLARAVSSASTLSLSGMGGGLRPSPSPSSAASKQRQAERPVISKAAIDEYRARIKAEKDPEAQFNFAKYLIEAARTLAKAPAATGGGDEAKVLKKYRDALLQESLKLIKRLATQSMGPNKPPYADAQFFLANCLGNGSLGLQVDHEKAYNLYVQASKQNHAAATYRTAVCNEVGAGTRRDHSRAVLFYRKASALGDTAGMYKLGMILLSGLLGEQRNAKEAIVWLTRAASQADEENPHSLHELGLLYEKPQLAGNCLPCDEAQARELFSQAAQLGYAPSQHHLGACYEFGSLTCPIDPRRSIAWYARAAERGNSESELALSGWWVYMFGIDGKRALTGIFFPRYLTGSEGVLAQSDKEAYLWARRAANKGLAKAEYAVGCVAPFI